MTPHPQPQKFLLRISVWNQAWNGNSYKGEPGRARNCSHCNFQDFHSLTKGNHVSWVRIHFSTQNQMDNHQTFGRGRVGMLKNQCSQADNISMWTPLWVILSLGLAGRGPAAAILFIACDTFSVSMRRHFWRGSQAPPSFWTLQRLPYESKGREAHRPRSEAWDPPQLNKETLSEWKGIPGRSRSNPRNGTHGLSYGKPQFSERLLESEGSPYWPDRNTPTLSWQV